MPIETRKAMSKTKSTTNEASGASCSCNLSEVLAEIKALRKESTDLRRELKQDSAEIKQAVNDLRTSVEYTQSEVDKLKQDVTTFNAELSTVKCESESFNHTVQVLKTKLLVQERYSRSYNLRIGGIREEEKEDCFSLVYDAFKKLGIPEEDYRGQVENAHRTGKYNNHRPRHIILKCYGRPFRTDVLRKAKRLRNKDELKDIFFLEDLTKEDFESKQRARPLMTAAYEEGKKVMFRAGKLFIDGISTTIPT